MKRRKFLLIPLGLIAVFFLMFILGGGLSMFRLSMAMKNNLEEKTANHDNFIDSPTILPDTDDSNVTTSDTADASTAESESNYRTAYKGSVVPDVLTDETLEKYLKSLVPADDEYDFKYAADYQDIYLVKIHKGQDASAYEKILGYRDVTLEQILEALNNNPTINEKYKEFIYQFACDLRTLYPDCNLAVLHHNLKTLIIDEMTQAQIDRETLSTDSAACYLQYENKICIVEDLNLSRESDDYIIMVHELCHAARSLQKHTDDNTDYDINIGFYENYQMGTYAQEGIITNIAYQLQGMGNRATFYPMLSSYYRIITNCIDYSGEDFFNHSVNYLIEQMDAFMGDENYAYQIVARIDAQMALRYTPYQEVDFYDFQPVYEYLARMYFKKNITPDMTREQAESVFDTFYEDITFNFENITRGYDINEDNFMPTFVQYLKELEIQ